VFVDPDGRCAVTPQGIPFCPPVAPGAGTTGTVSQFGSEENKRAARAAKGFVAGAVDGAKRFFAAMRDGRLQISCVGIRHCTATEVPADQSRVAESDSSLDPESHAGDTPRPRLPSKTELIPPTVDTSPTPTPAQESKPTVLIFPVPEKIGPDNTTSPAVPNGPTIMLNEGHGSSDEEFRGRVADVRGRLPSRIKGSGNVAVADIEIQGEASTSAATSRIDFPTQQQRNRGVVGLGTGNFGTHEVRDVSGRLVDAAGDAEAKILDNLADKLGNDTAARGKVTIFTELPACESCRGVKEQFEKRYPNIKVEIRDNARQRVAPTRFSK
jgi:hypothetical protein